MYNYTFKNLNSGETKQAISTLSLVLADEFFTTTYWYLGTDWKTVEI